VSELDELGARLAALEAVVSQEGGLRASQDRDPADLAATVRAQHHTLQALALTSSEHNMNLADMRRELTRQGRDIAEVREGMASLAEGVRQMLVILNRLDEN